MSQKTPGDLVPSSGGFFQGLTQRIKLILRLIGDGRVNPLLKILPIGSLIYWLFPDPAIGPIDDAAVIFIGMYLFVELCPPQIVEEHQRALRGLSKNSSLKSDEEVIEGEFREIDENEVEKS